MRLIGKHPVVTGGGSGIGAATARLFAAEGAHVAILDQDLPRTDESPPKSVSPVETLLPGLATAEEMQVRDSVGRAVQHFGAIDILFNSAGIAIRRTVSETEADDWDRIMETNLRGSFLCSKFCLQHFRQEGNTITSPP